MKVQRKNALLFWQWKVILHFLESQITPIRGGNLREGRNVEHAFLLIVAAKGLLNRD